MKNFFIGATLAIFAVTAAMTASAESYPPEITQATTPANSIALPTGPTDVIPPGAPAFNTNGMDFTNATFKVAAGYEIGSMGSLGYIQADADLWKLADCDIGLGGNIALGAYNDGLYSAAGDFELIKNLSNFQLVGKAGIGGNFQGTAHGVFGELGADINYNLSQGTGWGLVGTYTYVGAGVKIQASQWDQIKGGGTGLNKLVAIYGGCAF
jgi:opacity protein-like surface antigen